MSLIVSEETPGVFVPIEERRALAIGLVVLLTIYAALITVPPLPTAVGAGLDPSWMLGLNLAHARNFAPGPDFIFTYGPLGYVIWPDATSGAPYGVLAYHMGLYLLWTFALLGISITVRSKSLAFWVVPVLAMGVVLDVLARDNSVVITLIAVLLIPLASHSRWRYVELSVAAMLAGLAMMVKLNQGIEGAVLFLLVFAAVLRRDWPLTKAKRLQAMGTILMLPVSVISIYAFCTGGILGLWPYLRSGLQIVSGYSDGMAMSGPVWEITWAVSLLCLIFAAVGLLATDLRGLWAGLAPAVVAALFALKHAMVRQDDGHSSSFGVRVAVALLFLTVCARTVRDRRLILLLQIFAATMGTVMSIDRFPGFGRDVSARLTLSAPYTTDIAAFVQWSATWKTIGDDNASARKQISPDPRFDAVVGRRTVAAIPWNIDRVKTYDWNWTPNRVLQWYSAYTPALDRLNADQLEGGAAPELALVEYFDIDGRHPFLSEPMSWRALLDRYDAEIRGSDALLARHRNESRFAPPVPVGSQEVGWDQEIKVPQTGGLLLMSAHIEKSLTGQAASLLFRGAPVILGTKFEYGKTIWWRTVPPNLAEGVVIDPLPQTLGDLYSLFFPEHLQHPPYRVGSIQFHTDLPSQYQARIRIQWSRLPVRSKMPEPQYPLPMNTLTRLWSPKDALLRAARVEVVRGSSSIQVIPTGDDPQLTFRIPNLGNFRTIVVRARFQKADIIDAFFGKQFEGRGITGSIPVANRWLDVFLNLGQNPFWKEEHGTDLRFDPVPSNGPNTTTEIAAIWGTNAMVGPQPEIQSYVVPASGASASAQPGRTPVKADVEGTLDVADSSRIAGWVWDKSQPDVPIMVDIRDGDTVLASVPANGFRRDLLDAHKGNGTHAFSYAASFAHGDSNPHTIRVFISGTNLELSGSPKTVTGNK